MPSSIAPIASCLAKYINHEPIAAELETPHPLAPNDVQDAFRVLATGSAVSSPAKPHSYVFAIFPAANVSQSLLFDFTGTYVHHTYVYIHAYYVHRVQTSTYMYPCSVNARYSI